MFNDEQVVSSTKPTMSSSVDFGRSVDSPNSYFKCLYDSADLFGDACSPATPPANGAANGQAKLDQCHVKPELIAACPSSAGGMFGAMDAPPLPYSLVNHADVAPPPGYSQPYQQHCVPFRAHQQHSVPASPIYHAAQSSAQASPSSAMPDSTSFLNFPKPNGIGDRRASDGSVFDEQLGGSPMTPGGSAPYYPMRAQSADFAAFVGQFPDSLKHADDGTFGPGVSSSADEAAAMNGNGAAQKAFVPCKVCGDKASGYHYGVTSCEGCKGFFRRSIQKQIEYRCLRDGKCMVFRLNRNRCQYCRFKKCLAVGMSRDSVRYGRVPKRSRERMADDARVSSMSGDGEVDSELEKKQLALYDIILSVSQAHHSNCAYTDDKIRNLTQRPLQFPLDRCSPKDDDPLCGTDLMEQQKIVMWETLAEFTTPEIQRVVEFAKRIPGFVSLIQEDQLVLIKAGFFEVWLVRVARMLNPQHCTVTYADGSFVNRDQLDLIYNPELTAAMFTFAVNINNLHLNDGEIGLFTAVVLLSQDRPALSDPKKVELLQEQLIEATKLQLSRSHQSDPQVFPNLLMKLSELRSVGAKHQEVLGWYRMNWRRLKLPPLYAEIYDIAKSEEAAAPADAPLQPPPPPPADVCFQAPLPPHRHNLNINGGPFCPSPHDFSPVP